MRCFPQFPFCAEVNLQFFRWPILNPLLLAALASAGALAIFAFRNRRVSAGCTWLAVALALKTFWMFRTYDNMGNFHYMPFVMTMAFLVAPSKRSICALLMVLFYVSAGLLKFNLEWLSGAALYQVPQIPDRVMSVLVFLVPTLEVCFSWLLLSARPWLRRFSLGLFFLFHSFSWVIVGSLYPTVMFFLLAIFYVPEFRRWPAPIVPLKASTAAVAVMFMALQFTPYLFAQDPSLTGLPRSLSLNMFDARTECTGRIEVVKRGDYRQLPLDVMNATRIKCDPIILFAQVRRLCSLEEGLEVNVELWSRRRTSLDFTLAVKVDQACAEGRSLYWREVL